MSRLTWTERKYYSGVDRGVVYSRSGSVEVWNGLISVAEKPSDIRTRVRYMDGRKTVNQRSEDSFAATIDCHTYPTVLTKTRAEFDLTYRVKTNNGYEIHIVYNALGRFAGGLYAQNETTPFTFDIFTRPKEMPLLRKPSAHLVIDTSLAYGPVVDKFEEVLYGTDLAEPRLPGPEEVVDIFDVNALFQVVDNGDGTATISAPDEVFAWFSATYAIVDWPYVTTVDEDTVRIRNF